MTMSNLTTNLLGCAFVALGFVFGVVTCARRSSQMNTMLGYPASIVNRRKTGVEVWGFLTALCLIFALACFFVI